MNLRNIPYKFYSLNFFQIISFLLFIGFILGSLIFILKLIFNIGGYETLITFVVVLGLFLIWFIGHIIFYKADYKFVPSAEYFKKYERNLIPNIDCSNFKNYLNMYKDFLCSGKKILLIHSVTGHGKSHLLKEMVKSTIDIDNERIILFVKPNYPNVSMETGMNNEIEKRTKYLIIYDDVDVESKEVNELIAFCETNDFLKIILSFRNCEFDNIVNMINDSKYDEIRINWTEEDLVQFMRKLFRNSTIRDSRLIKSYSSPLLISVKKGTVYNPNFNFEKFRILVKKMDHDVKSCLREFNYSDDEKKYFIVNLACISPFLKENDVLEMLKNQTNFKVDEINKMIENLIKGGLLLEINQSIRFYSDILSYLYLYYAIMDYSQDKIELLFNNWVSLSNSNMWQYFPKNIYKNLGNAAEIFTIFIQDVSTLNIPSLDSYFSRIVNKWIDEEETTFGLERKKRLDLLQYFCHIVPGSCIDLLNAYLDSEPPMSDQSYLNDDFSTGNFSPIIIKLVNFPSVKKEIIDIIVKMESKEITDFYGHNRAYELIKSSVSPYHLDSRSILDTLNILEDFLGNLDFPQIHLISSALNEILIFSKHITEWGLFEYQSKEMELPNTPEVIKIRNQALKILIKLINYPSSEVKLESLKIVDKIYNGFSEDGLLLSDQIIKERKVIMTELGNLISKDTDFEVLNKIENLFLDWWAKRISGATISEDFLGKDNFPRDIEYIVSKHLIPGNYVVEDFEMFKSQAPEDNRWKWFVGKKHDYLIEYYRPEYYKKLVYSLNKEYDNEVKLINFLKNVDNNLSNHDSNYNVPLIACWFKLNPKMFLSIKNDVELWKMIPKRFKGGIELAISELGENYLVKLKDEILSEIPDISLNKLNLYFTALGKSSIDNSRIKGWLDKILRHDNSDIRISIVKNLLFIFKDDYNSISKIMLKVLAKEPYLNKEMILYLSINVSDIAKNDSNINSDILENLRNELVKKLVKIHEIDHYAQELLNFAFDNIDTCFKFIKSRIRYYEAKTYTECNPVPFDGIEYIKNNISSYEDYESFMDKFLSLYLEKEEWQEYLINLIKPLKRIHAKKDLFLRKYIENQIKKNNIENVVVSLNFLPLKDETCSLFVEISEKAISPGKYHEIKDIIDSKTSFDSYSARAGEVPEEFIRKLKLLEKMFHLAKPGKFRNMIYVFIEDRKEGIGRHESYIEESKYSH